MSKEWEDHAKRRVVQPIAARSHATASGDVRFLRHIRQKMIKER
jgi:hypothetical protein